MTELVLAQIRQINYLKYQGMVKNLGLQEAVVLVL